LETAHKQELGSISTTDYINELKNVLGYEKKVEERSPGSSYRLLRDFCEKKVIPNIIEKNVTIATVETTTCGLLSDLLTGVSGASHYFVLGIVPYSKDSKVKLGVPNKMLTHEGPGTVSMETAVELSTRIREFSGAKVGIAETGLLQSKELANRKTKKKPGLVFLSISNDENSLEKKLDIQANSSRILMRHEIAYRVLSELVSFLESAPI